MGIRGEGLNIPGPPQGRGGEPALNHIGQFAERIHSCFESIRLTRGESTYSVYPTIFIILWLNVTHFYRYISRVEIFQRYSYFQGSCLKCQASVSEDQHEASGRKFLDSPHT